MKEEKEIRMRMYIEKGILNDIDVVIQEKPTHTFLGSTDRKGYTLQFTATYMNKMYQCQTVIEPYLTEKQTEQVIERITEEAKHKLAEEIYKNVFTSQAEIIGENKEK